MKLSVVIAAKNEADRIKGCIESIGFADEMLVINDMSTDETRKISEKLGARVLDRELDGFAAQKNFGIDQAKNDWILILDADERLTPELAAEIKALKETGGVCGYSMPFRNHVGRRWLRHGGLYPDRHTRLFDRRKARYGEEQVHEQLACDGKILPLKHDVIHLTYRDWSEYKKKVVRYAELEARQSARPSWVFISKTFYRKFIREQGWRDGLAGLASAWLLTYYQIVMRRRGQK